MSALLFPGQGSQVVGMGKEFYDNFNVVKQFFDQADEKLKFSISKIILNGPESDLKLTKITQPAILTVSYSIFKVLKEEFNFGFEKFNFFAGHSLGEYSALVCSEALNFQDALTLVHERGKAMQTAVPIDKGAMLAVMGVETFKLSKIIKNANFKDGICEIANDNANGQVIVSGDIKTIESLKNILKENKIKSIPLKVSAPFHCSLMKPASEKMKNKINETFLNKPRLDIVSNVTAKSENDINTLKKLLIQQIFSTVRWRESLIYMSDKGVKNFVEIGPGKVLSGMVKRSLVSPKCFSINSIADIKNLENEFKR